MYTDLQIQQEAIKTMRMLEETLAVQDTEKAARQQKADAVEAVQAAEANIAAVRVWSSRLPFPSRHTLLLPVFTEAKVCVT